MEEVNNSFLEKKIDKLDDKMKSLIYKELLIANNDKIYEKMKQYIWYIFIIIRWYWWYNKINWWFIIWK